MFKWISSLTWQSHKIHKVTFLSYQFYLEDTLKNEKSKNPSLSPSTHKKKLNDLIPGYEINATRFSHDPNKVVFNISSYVLTEDEKSLLWQGLRFFIPPKKIEHADFLGQFELLYRDTIMFKMKSRNRDFIKSKLKGICFSTFKWYRFDKYEKKISEAESITLKK